MSIAAPQPTDLIAGYAALVATAALALELRRWFDGRPKIAISVEAPWQLNVQPDRKYLRATVTNRWDKPFTIEYFAVMEFRSIWHRLILGKNCWNGLIWQPNPEKPLPYRLEPGELWDGFSEFTKPIEDRLKRKKLFVAVRCSFQNRPVTKRVRPTPFLSRVGDGNR